MADAPVSEFAHVHGQHFYKGIIYPNYVLDSSIDALRSFTVRTDDIWIVTYPKSGTHWVFEMVGLIQAGGDPDKINRSCVKTCMEMFDTTQNFPITREEELATPVDMTPYLEELDRAPSPRIMGTHMHLEALPPTLLDTAKVFYVARNPKDVITSYYNFTGKAPVTHYTWETMLEEFLNDHGQYGPWEKHVESFWKVRDQKKLLFLFYEDMKKDPVGQIRRVAEHLGVELSDGLLQKVLINSSFSEMKKRYGKTVDEASKSSAEEFEFVFYHKGLVGNWKNQFTVAQSEAFDEWYRTKMAESDIDINFQFE